MAFKLAPSSRTLVVCHGAAAVPLRPLEAKDPDDVVQYMWSLGEWLDAEATTLASYTVAIDAPSAPVLVRDSDASDADPGAVPTPITGRNVVVWLSAGALGVDYTLRLRAVTADGHVIDRSFIVPVRRR